MSHAHLKHCFRTILKPSAFHIGMGVALHAQAAVLVYINAVISVTEVILARAPRALEARSKGVVASRGRVRGVKVAVRG